MTAPVVELDRVTRRYGEVVALDDVSLSVGEGELVGLLGPNGAGKSTLLSLVNGVRRPDAGTVRLMGRDPREPAARAGLGTTPQETGLPATLRVGEVVDLVAGHYADPMPRGEVLERFGLGDLARRQTGGLSGGQRRRLAVALSLVGRPRVVLLDEPTTGLDVDARHTLWDALRDYQSGGATVIVTSHYLEEIEALARRVVVVGSGRVLADDDLPAVLAMAAARRVLVEVPESEEARLHALPGVLDVRREGRRTVLLAPDADAVVRALVRDDVPFRDLEVRGASLEEAFLALTSGTPGAPAASGAPGAAPTPATTDGEPR
ncbi:ABC transporter ATP-binding protein [Cellulomonas pakistanensis]|uniref:ABC transporter ATP-binding protein n=1 Tax=Cellulomonas pakistanensis TaxID=992287 RepID=A0A919U549_9CELL|nr:ABC transporter ATP-binding protein [Cellulomonas pakistanensis]GIG34662.1 ABC transporter ATP-binding protein [Cellulomonas pakistanensis]